MKKLDFRGKLVVVTGASSGLGREIARSLAIREGANLVVAARRRDRLEELKAEIEAHSTSRVHVAAIDLGTPQGVQALFQEATSRGEVYALVNSAGITFYGKTLDASLERCEQILAVNQLAAIRASMLFLERFLKQGAGGILSVTSVYAFLSAPYQNMYSASKHAVQAFMEGLAREYRGRGVIFSTFAAGGIATEMITFSGMDRKFSLDSPVYLRPAVAARKAIDAFRRGKLCTVPGLLYKAIVILAKLAPRRLATWVAGRIFAP